MLTRRWVLGGLIAAPAVIAADKLMPVHVIPERYATVWGVGWDLEVVEHVVWTPNDAMKFARYDALDKFREVTEVVYTNPLPWPLAYSNHWTERSIPKDPMDRFAAMQKSQTVPVFDDPNEINGTNSFIRKLDLKEHWGDRHAEHLAELEKANRTRNDDWEIEGKHQHMIDVAHNYELSTGNSGKWDYDQWAAFRDANKATGQLPKVKFKPAVKSIV
jgi:hypothetical protein